MLPGTLVAIITHYALPTRAFPLSFLVYGAKTTPNLCMHAVRCPGCGDDAARYTCHSRPHHARRLVEVSMCPRLVELSRRRRRLRARLAQSRACSAPALTPSCARDDSLASASRTAYANGHIPLRYTIPPLHTPCSAFPSSSWTTPSPSSLTVAHLHIASASGPSLCAASAPFS
ncbi:hypothetical protein DFH06DRAFT_449043 [Mycena polygramma]|nr:hypothetical protein DFH06DRAFT_449043 [Mycena polygramma]